MPLFQLIIVHILQSALRSANVCPFVWGVPLTSVSAPPSELG